MVVVVLETAKDSKDPKYKKVKKLSPEYPTKCVEVSDYESAIKIYGTETKVISIEDYQKWKAELNEKHGPIQQHKPWWKRIFEKKKR